MHATRIDLVSATSVESKNVKLFPQQRLLLLAFVLRKFGVVVTARNRLECQYGMAPLPVSLD
jgi:hypothetical protein